MLLFMSFIVFFLQKYPGRPQSAPTSSHLWDAMSSTFATGEPLSGASQGTGQGTGQGIAVGSQGTRGGANASSLITEAYQAAMQTTPSPAGPSPRSLQSTPRVRTSFQLGDSMATPPNLQSREDM